MEKSCSLRSWEEVNVEFLFFIFCSAGQSINYIYFKNWIYITYWAKIMAYFIQCFLWFLMYNLNQKREYFRTPLFVASSPLYQGNGIRKII